MWERGLKYCELVVYPDEPWSLPLWERGLKFGGAWTENHRDSSVAPLVGAWIEIKTSLLARKSQSSLPLWERGLKLFGGGKKNCEIKSLPLWERGLK